VTYDPAGFKKTMKERKAAFAHLMPKSQDVIPTRSLMDGYNMAMIPVGSEKWLRNAYTSPNNHVRIGRIIEDFDTFCVITGHKYVVYPTTSKDVKLTCGCSTATIDNVYFTGTKPRGDVDLRIYGQVTWAGKSSLEVIGMIDQKAEDGSGWNLIAKCTVVLVVLDMLNGKIGIANRLVGTNPQEIQFIQEGSVRAEKRKEKNSLSLLRSASTDEERLIIRQKFYTDSEVLTLSPPQTLKRSETGALNVLMKDTYMSTVRVADAQDRNQFYTLFGGFTVRNSYELAFVTAWIFSRQKTEPTPLCGEDLTFKLPISIGDIIKFTSAITYVEDNRIYCFVSLKVVHPETQKAITTNTFQYIFKAGEDTKLPNVVPESFEETMLYIDCMRRFKRLKSQNFF